MTKIIAIANPRGGVGKTATAINLGVALALSGKKTLIIDLDPNMNVSTGLGLDNKLFKERNVFSVLQGTIEIKYAIHKTIYSDLQIISGANKLHGFDALALDGDQFKFKEKLAVIEGMYDFILFDCPPSLKILTRIALVSCNSYLIPIQCRYRDKEIVTLLLNEVEKIKATLNPSIFCQGILLTMINGENNFSIEIRNYFKEVHIFKIKIPESIELSKSFSGGKDLIQCAPNSATAVEYRKLALRDFVLTS